MQFYLHREGFLRRRLLKIALQVKRGIFSSHLYQKLFCLVKMGNLQ